uniref:Uncharacterized protein n=1 Tax=Timema douglasi TaxID=61478 RepID=A0A7R8Z9R2_TIMDO|nr:unnamed protein product [Timema douglasi]
MPASATGGAKPAAEVRAIVETLGLDGSVLGDGDFSALSLSHSNDQYTSSELERLVNIQAELEELSTAEEQDIGGSGDGLTVEGEDVEVSDTSTTFEHGQGDTILAQSPETILPDVLEGTGTTETDVHQVRIASPPPKVLETVKRPVSSHQPIVSTSLLYSSAAGTKSSQVTGSSIVVIQSPTSSNPSGITSGAPTHLTFSGGQLLGKISGMSNLTTIGSMPQFQSLGQTLVTAKSADGNIVQLRPAGISRSITATNTTGNTNPGTIQGIRPLQATIKRPGTSLSAPMRNVYAKVIIGNHSGQVNQGQPFMISTSQSGIGEATFTNRQSVKLINTSGGTQGTAILGTPPKAITLSQAQQMGLLTPSKLQQILPSSANKQSIILNKLVTSPGKSNATKITMVPSSTVMKSPTKILPAPVGSITQLKPTSTLASGPTLSVAATSASTTFRPLNSPQKVIIRQSALKSGTVLTSSGTGQMIRIPATQNIIGTLPGGKQVQYVRLVSTANSSTANVVSHTKPRTTTVFPVNAVTGVSAPKPLAITTVRNQPQALKVVPIAPATSAIRTVVPKPTTTTQNSQRILIPTSTPATQLRAAPSVTTLSASGVSQLMPGTTILQSSTGNYVMLPAQYIQQIQNQQANQQQQQQHHVSVPPSLPPASSQSSSSSQSPPESTVSGTDSHSQSRSSVTRTTVEPNGIRPRKPCNCTKSQCLKLTQEYATVSVASGEAMILVLLVVDLCCLSVLLVAVPVVGGFLLVAACGLLSPELVVVVVEVVLLSDVSQSL